MKYKKIISSILAISMLASLGVTSFAQGGINTPGGTTDVPVELTVTPAKFSVTVPSGLPITVLEDGSVEVATNAKVVNNSAGMVKIKNVEVSMLNGWSLDSFDVDFTDKAVNSKELGLVVNDVDANLGNIANGFDIFPVNSSQALIYDAKIAPQGESVQETIASLVFTVGWVDSEVLEGNGQTFHKMAPSALSFRSTAPLDEFQEVRINGQVVDPSNYTLTEGSTIVTLNIDYLNSLDADNHQITVVSSSKSPSGSFEVIEPEVNNYNFYYNQPYSAYVDAVEEKCAFFIQENGEMVILCVGPISTGVIPGAYTVEDGKLIINSELGVFTGIVSDDGSSIYCEELGTNFEIGDETIVADEEYVYTLNEYNGGYRASVIDKTKTSYKPIKMGIHGIPTTNLESTYADCVNLVVPPVIPYGVDNMDTAFGGCISLKKAPIIPSSVTGMIAAFSGCISLETAPVIPEGVIDLSSTFYRCYSLSGEIEINTTVLNPESPSAYVGCFSDTVKEIVIVGAATDEIKEVLASTAELGNVRYE